MDRPTLAMDPGLMTGLAWMINGKHGSMEVPYEQVGGTVNAFLLKYPDTRFVCESFIITQQTAKKSQSTWSLELIGVARYLIQCYGLEELTLQSPADAKRFASDSRLKALGWYKGGKGHADDASRHLMLYLAKRKEIDLGKLVDK